MIASAMGRRYVMFVVHSRTMTVMDTVMREMPPSIAAAPMSAKLPGGVVEYPGAYKPSSSPKNRP
eukprot:scaffold7704_cov112-Isochrysis_galbana.AAC.19